MLTIKSFHRSPQLAELKVSYKRRKTPDGQQLRMPWLLTSSQSAESYLCAVWDQHKLELVEDLYLVCLNGAQGRSAGSACRAAALTGRLSMLG